MKRQNLLPILRRAPFWIAFALAVLLLLVSTAWMDKTAADNRSGIEKVYEEMDVHFLLNAGRRSLSPGFRTSLHAIRTIEHAAYVEGFGCSDLSGSILLDPENRFGEWMTVVWTHDPEARGIRALKGELAEGIWLPAERAAALGVTVGDTVTAYTGAGLGGGKRSYEIPVTAITDADAAYMPEESFDKLLEWTDLTGNREFWMTDLHFGLKKEYNKKLSEIERELQGLLNTPHPADRNRDVTVNYNASEIDGMLKPLEKTIASAEFFGRLFRTALPAAAILIAVLAVLAFRNEIGVRRFLGEGRRAVFLWIWLPSLTLLLPGYLLSLLLLLTPLGPYVPWSLTLWHFAGTAFITALLTAFLSVMKPLDLLREKNDE